MTALEVAHKLVDEGRGFGTWEHALATALIEAEEALRAARPFVELEAKLANSGLGKLGRGDAPKALTKIDAVLGGWPVPKDEPSPLPPDYWETAE